jgi:hypothetical protein
MQGEKWNIHSFMKDGIREDDLPQLFSFTKSKMSSYQNESSLP